MLQPPGAATTTTTPDYQALNQKTKINTFFVNWDVDPHARLSLGYRYSSRIITDAGGDFIPIHENWALFGIVFRPTPQLRANFNFDAMYADNSFTRISPRQLQHYRFANQLQSAALAQLLRNHQHPGETATMSRRSITSPTTATFPSRRSSLPAKSGAST